MTDSPVSTRPRLIVTADDFGLHTAVNQAVERGYREGVLRAASLMVTAPAVADAVARARQLPGLAVGLHLVLADGQSALPPSRIPDLVDARGNFGDNMVRDGFRFFFLPHVRRQLATEIRAQFEAFAATGLPLDHVNAHKHFHLHPTVLSLMLSIGRDYGLRAVRWPAEPGSGPWLKPWLALMRHRLRRAGVRTNDHVFGIRHTGGMDEQALLDVVQGLPAGLSELYLHPAIHGELTPAMSDYRHADELAALLSPRVRQAVAEHCLLCRGFSDPAAA
ncbi:hopanoid biosynthesis associated protein HpnK [Dyella jiangningensis]|uniref:hopanoid biosynthesis-associated protein HpnK n=1 Tax=Dyella sp. AtDHG13 TaxID=1938897 RepID=UPI00088B6986|nr:hopanoid biosynthesis-associated protein HpnK [Dyella sp. AtDHG13]PXV60347.1 hopanoid biosynthesis associated protein HpnK [Dyella sp. AtDHG13]SDJ41735.1 hopanoid biosynthesis associated protein HpnK [Dyella jiangningensis]